MSESESMILVGMDVYQDEVTLIVFEGASKAPAVAQRLPTLALSSIMVETSGSTGCTHSNTRTRSIETTRLGPRTGSQVPITVLDLKYSEVESLLWVLPADDGKQMIQNLPSRSRIDDRVHPEVCGGVVG